jgi:Cu(I)/Ag(I) efflux system membrane fusion protein
MRLVVILLVALLAGCAKEVPQTPAAKPAAHVHVKYHCPMHPQIERDAPGECPICGMTLVKSDPLSDAGAATTSAASGTDRKPLYYRNPMDPAVRSDRPMKDSMGMDYVPVYAEDTGAEVRISPAVVNNLGVRTEAAVSSRLANRVDAVGYVGFDERKVQQVRPRAEGWVQDLAVRAMGEPVSKGQRLFTLYSPMLASAQQEYRDAQAIGNRELIAASRARLRALGIGEGAAQGGNGRVPFYAPISGVVTALEVQEGAMVTPEMPVMTITELGSLWVIAEVPESQSGLLQVGAPVEIRFPSLPGDTVAGKLEYLYPELDMETRTVRARITLDHPPRTIRPNMLASVSLGAEAGEEVVNIPLGALIRSGQQERVVVALGEGRFVARKVTAGAESGDRVAIREGLQAGEQVVVSGQFLLDSEANLRSGLDRLQD